MRPVSSFERDRSPSFGFLKARSGWLVVGLILLGLTLLTNSALAQDASKSRAALTGVWDSSTSLGDINGDGNLDLVLTGIDANENLTTTIYLGDGSGRFREADAGLPAVSDGSTSLGDLNGDGNLDLVLTGYETTNDNPIAKVYLGDGSGGFTEVGAGLTGVRTSSTSLGDIDGDGHLDLVVTGATSPRVESPTAKVYLGDGTGGFEEADAGLTGVMRGSTSMGDINGDGHLDLVITGTAVTGEEAEQEYTAKVYLGDGRGGFNETGEILSGIRVSATALGHVDGDGNLDLVATGVETTGGPLQRPIIGEVYLGNGSGGFNKAGADLTGVLNASISLGDLDGDGNLDLVITGAASHRKDRYIAKVYLGDGRGGFQEVGAGLTGVKRGSTTLGDINGDSNLDLVVTGTTPTGEDAIANPTSTVYLGDGSGGFTEVGAN